MSFYKIEQAGYTPNMEAHLNGMALFNNPESFFLFERNPEKFAKTERNLRTLFLKMKFTCISRFKLRLLLVRAFSFDRRWARSKTANFQVSAVQAQTVNRFQQNKLSYSVCFKILMFPSPVSFFIHVSFTY